MSCSAIFILSSVYIVITSVWLGGILSPKCLHYDENISVSFNLDLVLRYPQIRCILGRHVAGIARGRGGGGAGGLNPPPPPHTF